MSFKLSEIAQRLGLILQGEDKEMTGVAGLAEAGPKQISFISNPKYIPQLATTKAGAVVMPEEHAAAVPTALLSKDPYRDFSRIITLFAKPQGSFSGISEQAAVHAEAVLGQGCTVYPFCYIGARAKLGKNVTVFSGCYVGEDAEIGDESIIYPNCSVMAGVIIGKRCILNAGAVLGSDGFGFVPGAAGIEKIPQIGIVRIGNDVEIGANTTIDRATLGETSIGDGTKIDNLVMLAHNVQVGKYTMLVSQTGIAGSTKVGDRVVMAGQAGVSGHIEIGDGAVVGPKTGVAKSIPAGESIFGMPPMNSRQYLRFMAVAPKLPEIPRQLKKLEEEVARLKKMLGEQE